MSDHGIILLVEDRPDDVLLIRKSFERAGIPNPIHVVRDGQEAVDYLSGTNAFANRSEFPLPDLVLLDINMPKMDGFELLEWIRHHPGLCVLPVVVLTSSSEPRDVDKAYGLRASSFLVKPDDFEGYIDLGRIVGNFWMRTALLPECFRTLG